MSFLCLFLFVFQEFAVGSIRYWFIPENLALSWLSLLFAWVLVKQLKVRRWVSWQNISLTVLWLGFLPNAWYVLTDFLHIYSAVDTTQLYDIVLMSTLVVSGFIVGFTSLYLVHRELDARLGAVSGLLVINSVILLSSFAIYLGRFLRWNTWDVVTNPSGVILNVSDRIVDPLGYPRAITLTALFFLFIGVIYWAIWIFLKPQPQPKSH